MNLAWYILFVTCYCSRVLLAWVLSDAEQLALETSGELLPPKNLSRRIEKDLFAIRSRFRLVDGITNPPKWSPGMAIMEVEDNGTFQKLNQSRFGPIEVKPFVPTLLKNHYVVWFFKPYNPEKLAQLVASELKIDKLEPYRAPGEYTDITLTTEPTGRNTYVFFQGAGDCTYGCIHRRYMTFEVDQEQKLVRFVQDTGPIPGEYEVLLATKFFKVFLCLGFGMMVLFLIVGLTRLFLLLRLHKPF